MARVKQVAFYGLLIVIFAIFSDFMIKVGLKNTYKEIPGIIDTSSPEIVINEVKTTDVDGYAKGTIKNNTEESIDKIYIKLDLYSKRDINLGTKYLEIKSLNKEQNLDFEIQFRYSNVDHYKITCIDSKTYFKEKI